MSDAACCTCATLLSVIPPQYDEKTEKPTAQDRRLDCCGRVICGKCTTVLAPLCALDLRLELISCRKIRDLRLTVYTSSEKLQHYEWAADFLLKAHSAK